MALVNRIAEQVLSEQAIKRAERRLETRIGAKAGRAAKKKAAAKKKPTKNKTGKASRNQTDNNGSVPSSCVTSSAFWAAIAKFAKGQTDRDALNSIPANSNYSVSFAVLGDCNGQMIECSTAGEVTVVPTPSTVGAMPPVSELLALAMAGMSAGARERFCREIPEYYAKWHGKLPNANPRFQALAECMIRQMKEVGKGESESKHRMEFTERGRS